MQIAVAPTVFVAIGGTGQIILQRLRRRLEQRIGTADMPFFRYLYLDTDQGALQGALTGISGLARDWSKMNVIEPSADTIARVRDPQMDNNRVAQRLDVDNWFDAYARNQLGAVRYAQGVGGRRMLSRLGFLGSQNLGPLTEELIAFYNALITCGGLNGQPLSNIDPPYLEVIPRQIADGVRFVVVTSAGGGTGSGSVIDFGFLLRMLRYDQNWAGVHQFAYIALARSGLDTPNQVRNSAALLTELDYYDGTQTYNAGYLALPNSPGFQDRNPPYESTFVSMATQMARPLKETAPQAFDDLLWRMAEYLLADCVGVYGDTVEPAEVKLPRSGPVGSIAFLGDVGLNPSGVETFGVSCREWPAAMIHRRIYGSVIRRVAKGWSEPQPQAIGETVSSLRDLLGIPPAAAQANADARSLEGDQLKEALLAPVNSLDPMKQLDGLKSSAYDERGRMVVAQLGPIRDAISKAFQERAGAPSRGDEPGVVSGVVRQNRDTLLDRANPESLPRKIADKLLALSISAAGGPASASAAGRELGDAIQREADFVEECLRIVKPARPESPGRIEMCWQYANDALLQAVLQAKQEVYRQMGAWVLALGRRLDNFAAYIGEWAQGFPPEADEGTEAPSLVVPPALVQRLQRAAEENIVVGLESLERDRIGRDGRRRPGMIPELRDLIERGLPEKDDAGNPTLFAEGFPKAQGRPDFSYLDHVQRAIYSGIAQGPASPYREQVLALLLEEANRSNSQMPNMLGESQFLLNYRIGAPEYGSLPFGGNPTHVTQIVQPNQDGYPAFEAANAGQGGWLDQWQGVGRIKHVSVDEHVTKSLNTYVAGFVSERCSIKTEFIVGYDLPDRRRLFTSDPFPAVSDRRIRLRPDPETLRRAQMLFLSSIVLRQWQYLGGHQPYHELSYSEQDPQTGFTLARKWHAARDFPVASWSLAESQTIMDAVEMKIQVYLRDNLGEAATIILKTCQAIVDRSQQQGSVYAGDFADWNLDRVPYDRALDVLQAFAQEFGVPMPPVPHPYAVYLRRDASLPQVDKGKAAQDGWYCVKCSYSFGMNMPPRSGEQGRCPVCRHPFAGQQGQAMGGVA